MRKKIALPKLFFSDVFEVSRETLDAYGAFDISLVADLPLFIDPFLLFNSKKPEYQQLHHEMIRYLAFLRDKSIEGNVSTALLKDWYHFKEVKQTWLGFSKNGNNGSGLGVKFALALNENFGKVFADDGISKGKHLEKLCLIRGGVGKDNISDFTTNLVKTFLLEYTEQFAQEFISPSMSSEWSVTKSVFNYETESWETRKYHLPSYKGDYVILAPKDILTRDNTWINSNDLERDFMYLPQAVDNDVLRAQIDNYFKKALGRNPKATDRKEAIRRTLFEFPILVDYFIKRKEDQGDQAVSLSGEKVNNAEHLFIENFGKLAELLAETEFFDIASNSRNEAVSRLLYLKDVIENKDGYRLFYGKDGKPIKREEDLQIAYRLIWYGSNLDVNREVNNGRGPVDFKISKGAVDAVLVEFKLASNSSLEKNLKNQVAVYEAANGLSNSLKGILFFTDSELILVNRILRKLGLESSSSIVLFDARRSNKVSASKVRD